MQWTASPPAKTARPKGGGKDAAPKVLRVEALTPRQVAEVAAGVDAEKLRLEELKRRRSEARAAAAEAAEGQSAEEAEAAQLRSLLHDDDAPSDLAADYGGEAYDAAEAEAEQALRKAAEGARNAAEANRLADKNRKATLIQQFFLRRAEDRRRATADPRVEMYLERLDRFTLLEKQTKQLTDESEAALEVAGTQCCFCGVPWGRKHAAADADARDLCERVVEWQRVR